MAEKIPICFYLENDTLHECHIKQFLVFDGN